MQTTLILCAIGALIGLIALIVYAWQTTKEIDADVKAACDFQPLFPAKRDPEEKDPERFDGLA